MINTIVKVTKAQMDTLEGGGSIGSHTYDPEHCLYLVDDGLELPDENGFYALSTDDGGHTYQYVNLTVPQVKRYI